MLPEQQRNYQWKHPFHVIFFPSPPNGNMGGQKMVRSDIMGKGMINILASVLNFYLPPISEYLLIPNREVFNWGGGGRKLATFRSATYE